MKKIYKLLSAGLITVVVQSANAQCAVPASVIATPSVICAGGTTSLSAISAGSSINWYTVPVGGTPTGTSTSGGNYTLTPVTTNTYYAEAFVAAAVGGSMTLNYTGAVQQVIIPTGITSVTIVASGAQGVNGTNGLIGTGGLGGIVSGVLAVTPGQTLNVYVGGQNGYNGGGLAGTSGTNTSGNGGGASDVRLNGITLADRVIVAGGGGGGAGGPQGSCVGGPGGNGGVGGNTIGGSGTTGNGCGTGGTFGTGGDQSTGGIGGTGNSNCSSTGGTGTVGVIGIGGDGGAGFQGCSGYTGSGGGGGGGGYYGGAGGGGAAGGGGGAWSGGGGGGGSSYGGTLTSVTYTAGAQTGNGLVTIYGFSGGCFSTSRTAVSFTVNPTPIVSAASSASLICSGQTATLTAGGATSYSWNTTASTSVIAVSPTITTSYTVTGTNSNSCTNVATITQSVSACTGIIGASSAEALAIKIYPNPSKGDFIISADSEMNLSLVNSLGQVVKVITINSSNNYQASVTNLANGIYFIVGENNHKVISQKIIVAK